MLGTKKGGNARVPMDDHHTMTFSMTSAAATRRRRPNPIVRAAMLPNTTDWYGRFRPEQNPTNDFQIDRDAQRENTGSAGYTGHHAASRCRTPR